MPNELFQKLFLTEPLLNITLASGHQIKAMSLHVNHTYEGQLVGSPCEKINKGHLERLPLAMQKVFGEWPVYIVPPVIERPQENPYPDDPELAPAFFPPLEVAARFECAQPLSPKMDGSYLIIAWYQHSCPPLMAPNILEQVERISWHEHAKDFEF